MVEADLAVLGAVILAATFARGIARALAAPAVAAFIATGVAARPFIPPGDAIEGLLFISLAFLVFAAGARASPERLTQRSLLPGILVGLVGSALAALPAFGLALFAGWSSVAAVYAAVAVGASSTLVVFSLLTLRREMTHPHGQLLVRGLLLQDLLLVVILAVLPRPAGGPGAFMPPLSGVALLAALAILVGLLLRWRPVWTAAPDVEVRTLMAFGLGLGGMLLASELGLPSPVGAFLAGLALSVFPANVQTRPAIQAAREFFTPVFFVTLGVSFPLPGLRDLPLLVGLLGLIVVLKPIFVALFARVAGYTQRASAETGVLAGQGSEFSIVLVMLGLMVGDLSPQQGGALWITIALSMFVTSVLPRRAGRAILRLLPHEERPATTPQEGHVVVVGAGMAGQAALEILNRERIPAVAVDVDPHALETVPRGVPTILGDAEEMHVLKAANVPTARAVLAFLKSDRATIHVFQNLRHYRPLGQPASARVRTEEAARAMSRLDVIPVHAQRAVERALARALDRIPPGRGE